MANGKWQLVNGQSTTRRRSACAAALVVFTIAIFHFPFSMPPRAHAAGRQLGDFPKNLREIKTRHYEIHTDLEPGLVVDLSNRMDTMYEEYARRLSEFKPPADAARLPVFLFSKKADYDALTGNQAANTAGAFVYAGDNAFLAAYLQGQGRDKLRRTLQHEAFHQFAYFAISRDLPIWLNEGMAQFFEEGLWTGKTFWTGQVPPRRLWDLQEKIKQRKLVEFSKLLAITPDEWLKVLTGKREMGELYYEQAWSMVHFLVDGNGGDYRAKLFAFLKKLHAGQDADSAFNQAFSKNVQGFQDRYAQWIVNLQPTPEAKMINRQESLADLLLRIEPGANRFKDMSAYRHHVLRHFQKGDGPSAQMPQTYFSDSSDRLYSERDLYFVPSPGGSLPDIVCRATPQFQFRTHFYPLNGKTEYEVLIEPAGK